MYYYKDTDGNLNSIQVSAKGFMIHPERGHLHGFNTEALRNTVSVYDYQEPDKNEFQKNGELIFLDDVEKVSHTVVEMNQDEINEHLRERDNNGYPIKITVDYSLIERDLQGNPAPLTYFAETLRNRQANYNYDAETRKYVVYLNYWRNEEKTALEDLIAGYGWTSDLIDINEIL
jgi:hypothetical protein